MTGDWRAEFVNMKWLEFLRGSNLQHYPIEGAKSGILKSFTAVRDHGDQADKDSSKQMGDQN